MLPSVIRLFCCRQRTALPSSRQSGRRGLHHLTASRTCPTCALYAQPGQAWIAWRVAGQHGLPSSRPNRKPTRVDVVMPGLVPGIHVLVLLDAAKTWMAGTSPAMTAWDGVGQSGAMLARGPAASLEIAFSDRDWFVLERRRHRVIPAI